MIDPPELSPKLIEKLKASGLEEIAEALSANDASRIDLSFIDNLPTSETEEYWKHPEGFTSPVGENEQINYFIVRSRKRLLAADHYFVATTDWKRLGIPLLFLPPEVLADPILKRWAWTDSRDDLGTEEACKTLARAIVRRHDNLPVDIPGRVTFEVETPRGKHKFFSTGSWCGLLAPDYMVPEEHRLKSQSFHHVVVISEEDVQGEKAVKREAKKLARAYDKTLVQPQYGRPVKVETERLYFWLGFEAIDKIKRRERYMRTTDPTALHSRSAALRAMIDASDELLPPEAEWKRKTLYPWERISGKTEI